MQLTKSTCFVMQSQPMKVNYSEENLQGGMLWILYCFPSQSAVVPSESCCSLWYIGMIGEKSTKSSESIERCKLVAIGITETMLSI